MRIVSLVPEGAPSSLYRSFIPMQALALNGHRVHVEERNELGDPALLRDVDVVHVFRLIGTHAAWFVAQLRAAGVAVVWDNDFDIASAPETHPVGVAVQTMDLDGYLAAEREMLSLATMVTVPTEELAERYRELAPAEVHVLPNLLPPTFLRPRTLPQMGLTIGWTGMQEHEWDYEQLGLREAIGQTLTNHRHVRVLGIGMDLELQSPRYEHVPWQQYDALPQSVARLDIALAPLADVAFNQTRSNVKLKEYAAVGVPWLASPVGEYLGMDERHGGRLVADRDWARQIDLLVRDEAARHQLVSAGRRWTRSDNVVEHVEELEQIFGRAEELAEA